MGRTGTTGLRFYLRWLSDLGSYSTLCSAKTRTSGEGVNVLNSLLRPSGNGRSLFNFKKKFTMRFIDCRIVFDYTESAYDIKK
jgi:hypothetical protein